MFSVKLDLFTVLAEMERILLCVQEALVWDALLDFVLTHPTS